MTSNRTLRAGSTASQLWEFFKSNPGISFGAPELGEILHMNSSQIPSALKLVMIRDRKLKEITGKMSYQRWIYGKPQQVAPESPSPTVQPAPDKPEHRILLVLTVDIVFSRCDEFAARMDELMKSFA